MVPHSTLFPFFIMGVIFIYSTLFSFFIMGVVFIYIRVIPMIIESFFKWIKTLFICAF